MIIGHHSPNSIEPTHPAILKYHCRSGFQTRPELTGYAGLTAKVEISGEKKGQIRNLPLCNRSVYETVILINT